MKILIATDGSEYSKLAIKECSRLFPDIKNSRILVVCSFEEEYALAAEPFAVAAEYYQQMSDAAKRGACKSADAAADLLKAELPGSNLDIEVKTLSGPPEKEIVEAAKAWGADIIVVGSHGRGFWGRLTLGSVSDAVIHHAPCSVLVVRKPFPREEA